MGRRICITEEQLENIKIHESYNNTVKNMIHLVESRGMFTNYEYLIDPIIRYVQDYIDKNNFNKTLYNKLPNNNILYFKEYDIIIPDELLNRIEWANNKKITFKIYDFDYKDLPNVKKYVLTREFQGINNMLPTDKIDDNGKLNSFNIIIYGISIDKKLYKQNIHNILYHEITHSFENYNRIKKMGINLYNDLNDKNYSSLINKSNSQIMSEFKYINYSILVPSELNALVASTYGDLENMNSERKNFYKDIKQTKSYQTYQHIKNQTLPFLIKLNNEFWEEFRIASYVKKDKLTNSDNFKKQFITLCDIKLKQLINGIGKVASEYYDRSEIVENIKKQNGGIIMDNIGGDDDIPRDMFGNELKIFKD